MFWPGVFAQRPANEAPSSGGFLASESIESPYSPARANEKSPGLSGFPNTTVVYLFPPEDPALELPIGDGDLGALLWTADSQFILAINKCDTREDNERAWM